MSLFVGIVNKIQLHIRYIIVDVEALAQMTDRREGKFIYPVLEFCPAPPYVQFLRFGRVSSQLADIHGEGDLHLFYCDTGRNPCSRSTLRIPDGTSLARGQ